jgi:hypothetical protein
LRAVKRVSWKGVREINLWIKNEIASVSLKRVGNWFVDDVKDWIRVLW